MNLIREATRRLQCGRSCVHVLRLSMRQAQADLIKKGKGGMQKRQNMVHGGSKSKPGGDLVCQSCWSWQACHRFAHQYHPAPDSWLRQAILVDESELYDTFSEQDRREPGAWVWTNPLRRAAVLFYTILTFAVMPLCTPHFRRAEGCTRFLLRIFQHLIFGGASNQPESKQCKFGGRSQ